MPSASGLTMTSTPTNPAATADQRRMRTISPRNSTAPIVTNNGDEYESAIACASGRCTIAQKPAIMPSMPITQRATVEAEFVGDEHVEPRTQISGSANTAPNRLRKNAISNGCCWCDA